MGVNLLADDSDSTDGINLLADESTAQTAKPTSFYDLSKEDQAKAMNLARQQLSTQYPNMPSWMHNMMLSMAPKDASPRLEQAGDFAEANTNSIPVTAGGLLQGFATPFQGAASFIPGKIAKDFANQDFTSYFPGPRNANEQMLSKASEFAGSLGPLGKLFGALKGGAQLARIPKALQNATALAGTGAIATPGDVGDKTTGAAGALALGGAGKLAGQVGTAVGTKVPAFLRGLFNESTPQALVDAVQKPHDILSNTADQLYDYVRGAIKNRNISIPVKPEYLQQAEDVLSNTRANKKLISNAKSGDYNAVHDLQSQLYKKGTGSLASDDIALQNQGEETIDLRNKINDDLKDHLIQNGHADIAHVLDQGKSVYKQLMNTYFNRNLPTGIGKMVQSDLRLIPENPQDLFSQNSKPMKTFLQQHPEAARHVQGIKEKEAATQALGSIFNKTAKIGGAGYAAKSLFDLLK